MKHTLPHPEAKVSIDRAASLLTTDRRRMTKALRSDEYIEPCDFIGTRDSPRWTFRDACELLAFYEIQNAPADFRPWSQEFADEHAAALAAPCIRCGGQHVEAVIEQPYEISLASRRP